MSSKNKNFFDLCNEVLDELYYEQVENFNDLEGLTEGRRVKKELNRALYTVCNNENANWQFRETEDPIILIAGERVYDKPNGFIRYLKRADEDVVLNYIEDNKWMPENTTGTPTSYWMDGEKIKFFPIPDQADEGRQINVQYYTDNFAKDKNGVGKSEMEFCCDTPIIPNKYRSILVYRVCADWRANDGDPKSQYYERKYREAYRAMRENCIQSEDYPSGLNIMGQGTSIAQNIYFAFQNKYRTSRGQM